MKLFANALLICLLTVPLCCASSSDAPPKVSGKTRRVQDVNVTLLPHQDKDENKSLVVPNNGSHVIPDDMEKGVTIGSDTNDNDSPTKSPLPSNSSQANDKIVGGDVVEKEDLSNYPFFVNGGGCGGTLVTSDLVLTAAHCNQVFWRDARVGPQRNAKKQNGLTEWVDIVSKMHVHPDFSWKTMENDFMIFKVAPVKSKKLRRALNEHKVTLNFDPTIPEEDEWLTTIGFGATSEEGPFSKLLREVRVQYIPPDECNKATKYDGAVDEKTQLCAGVDGGGKDSCQGDSGGPILAADTTLVGIVSWGYGCASSQYPGVYARVSSAETWIKETICKLSDDRPLPDFCPW